MALNSKGTSHDNLAAGTTAQRPGSPTSGMMRFNTNLGALEYYDGTSWRKITDSGNIGNGKFTLNTGTGLSGSGAITMNDSTNKSATISADKNYLDGIYGGGGGGGSGITTSSVVATMRLDEVSQSNGQPPVVVYQKNCSLVTWHSKGDFTIKFSAAAVQPKSRYCVCFGQEDKAGGSGRTTKIISSGTESGGGLLYMDGNGFRWGRGGDGQSYGARYCAFEVYSID